MKLLKDIFYILTLTALVFSCRNNSKYPYTLKDFNSNLQSHLSKIVSSGIVGYSPSEDFVEKHATDKELIRLSESEHPILRAFALRAMLERTDIDHFQQLMTHLDDTAIVTVDRGEFGTDFSTVTDDFINFFQFKSQEDKSKAVDKVISEHNYLKSAYSALPMLEPKEEYYKHIKEMALREVFFEDAEKALYRLASYKKEEDLEVIKSKLLKNFWRMNLYSFRLMKEFPNPTYLEVLDKYAKRKVHSTVYQNRDVQIAESFFEAVASYDQRESVEIFKFLLIEIRPLNCYVDTSTVNKSLIYSIWHNASNEYAEIRGAIKPKFLYYENNSYTLNLDVLTDTTQGPIWW